MSNAWEVWRRIVGRRVPRTGEGDEGGSGGEEKGDMLMAAVDARAL